MKKIFTSIGRGACTRVRVGYYKKNKNTCEIEDFVETHLCKLCVILRSRVSRVVCPHLLAI